MEIILKDLAKRYGNQWIFRNLNSSFNSGKIYGIQGRNGSGKSTLLQIISGFLSYSKGQVHYSTENNTISRSDIYKYISYVAPYVSLIDALSLREMIQHHYQFKSYPAGMNYQLILAKLNIPADEDQIISEFSSGMKQRLKLGINIISKSPILLLDEPTSTLDQDSKSWYTNLLSENNRDKVIIIASNEQKDLDICDEELNIEDYK